MTHEELIETRKTLEQLDMLINRSKESLSLRIEEEIAAARKSISYLAEQVAQVVSDLGPAHQLGPVVRDYLRVRWRCMKLISLREEWVDGHMRERAHIDVVEMKRARSDYPDLDESIALFKRRRGPTKKIENRVSVRTPSPLPSFVFNTEPEEK